MIKDLNIDALPQAIVYEPPKVRDRSSSTHSNLTVETEEHEDPEIAKHEERVSDSPTIVLRKKLNA